jgi:hypothetical protein
MKKNIYILVGVCFVCSIVWAANPMNTNTTISWYGQGSLLDNQEFSDNQLDDDDIERKRRHRRRRKIRPPRKGW